MTIEEKHFIAAKALLRWQGKILLLRESTCYADGRHAGFYDVPGGRLDPDETLESGLRREIIEETGLSISSAQLFFANDVIVEKPGMRWHIKRHYFACDAVTDRVVLSGDHNHFMWVNLALYKEMPIIDNLAEVFAAYNARF